MHQFAAMQLTTVAVHVGGPAEADWIRWAGILLAFSGTLAAAPAGVVRLLRSPRATAEVFGKWVLDVTGITIRKDFANLVTEGLVAAAAALALLMYPKADESGATSQIDWNENARLKVKVEHLHKQISIMQQAADSREAKLRADLDQARAATTALETRLDSADLGGAKSAARGVMLIGAGVILTGVPDGLARVAWIGWLAFAIALLLFISVVLTIAQEWRAAAKVHRTAQPPDARTVAAVGAQSDHGQASTPHSS